MASGPRPPGPLLFGVATSDHQCEAFEPEFADIQDAWEKAVGKTPRGRATDFWNRFPEDIEHARSLGCRAFRFSVAWSRVEPEPGRYSDEAFDHYARLVAAIRDAGMEPILTLMHFTWPSHVQARGGLAADDFPAVFQGYAAEVARRIGGPIRYWVTINELNMLPFGYIKFWFQRNYAMPPGLDRASPAQQVGAAEKVIRNLFLAHTRAREAIKANQPSAMVGANPFLLGLPGWFQALSDFLLTRRRDPSTWRDREARAARAGARSGGEADVTLATLTMTRERRREVLFSESYEEARPALLVKADATATTPADLTRSTIAVVSGGRYVDLLPRSLPSAHALPLPYLTRALAALDDGRADAIFDDDVALLGLIGDRPGRYRMIDTDLPATYFAAAVGLKNGDLLDVVDAAIRRFKASGAWAASRARYLPEAPVSAPPAVALRASLASDERPPRPPNGPLALAPPGTALHTIQDRGYVRVAVGAYSPGFSRQYNWKTGIWHGLEIDLARAIASEIFGDPSKLRIVPVVPSRRLCALRSWLDALLDPLRKLSAFFSTLFNTNWWHLGMAGRLPEFLCPSECVGQQDYVGFDYYWGIGNFQVRRLVALIDSTLQHFDRSPVWPGALGRMIRFHARLFPGREILIIENGCVDMASGVDRATYIRRHVEQVRLARRDGIPVSVYVCWSITTNREWGLPMGAASDFGLYHIDLDADPDLARKPTPAATAYRDLIAEEDEP